MSREYWSGNKIASLNDNEVFVFESNPVLSFKLLYPFNCPK